MNISIFTPSHNSAFLDQVYQSIKDQDFFEWVILLNSGAQYENADLRVKTFRDDGNDFVGRLKARCCEFASGDILLELDHDDLLAPHCVEEVRKAFQDPEVGFVYSNSIRTTADWKPTPRFGNYGWKYRSVNTHGSTLDEYVAFPPTPSSVSRIWYAPDHVRAFRKSVYDAVGGYNREMRVLDDQDLMCRLYLATKFKHIDKPLYIYRVVDNDNTWLKNNAEIQNNVMRIHDQYIEPMASRWANLNQLQKLDLGGRINAAPGFETVDLKQADICCDLNERWPFGNRSIGVIRAFDVFEHLHNSVHTMKELYRVLAPGGYAFIQVPSTDGRGAFQDPTHVSFWNENSFLYYADSRWAKYIDTPVRFQVLSCVTTEKDANQVCWVKACLVRLPDDGSRVPGEVRI